MGEAYFTNNQHKITLDFESTYYMTEDSFKEQYDITPTSSGKFEITKHQVWCEDELLTVCDTIEEAEVYLHLVK
jgi:hypothetical protein